MPGGAGFLPSTVNRISPTTVEIPNSSLDLEHLPNPKHPSGERDSHTGAGSAGDVRISRGSLLLVVAGHVCVMEKGQSHEIEPKGQ